MSLSNSRHAYLDCFALLDAALAEPRGIRAEVPSIANATRLRLRIHQARAIDRAENAKTYPEDHPLYNRSPYDCLVCRIEEADRCWVYIDKQQVEIGIVEPIPEGYQIEQPKPQLRIEFQPKLIEGSALQIRRR